MEIRIGHAVEGEDFFDRERELQRMAEKLQDRKASVFIPGQRRIGKTSLVKEFIRRYGDRYKFIYFDLEGRRSIVELCRDLIGEIPKSFPDAIKSEGKLKEKWNVLAKMIPEIGVQGLFNIKTGEITDAVKEITDRMEELFGELHQHDFIFAFDEFSDFLLNLKEDGDAQVRFFLQWLRRMRQQENLSLILTGSINIISTVEDLHFTHLINDLIDIEITPLEPGQVKTFLKNLLKEHVTLTDEALDFAAEKLRDGIPFYIQLFADGLTQYIPGNRTTIDLPEIEKLYARITDRRHKEFIDLHARLKTHLPKLEFAAAKKILAHTCFSPHGFEDLYPYLEPVLPDKSDLNKLLMRLCDECYLIKEAGEYAFVSPMLADWWKNNYDWEK